MRQVLQPAGYADPEVEAPEHREEVQDLQVLRSRPHHSELQQLQGHGYEWLSEQVLYAEGRFEKKPELCFPAIQFKIWFEI